MVNTFLRRTGLALLSGSLIVFSFSRCNNSDEVGLNLTPPGDRFHFFVDSTTLITGTTLRQDSLTAEKRDPVLLGSMVDPVFGRSTASFMAQLRLSANDVDFGVNPQIDSVIMLLKYSGYHGDTTAMQGFKVYEMTNDLIYDSTYYSNQDVSTYFNPSAVLADYAYYPKPQQDSISIRLADDFGNRILATDTAYLSGNPAWLTHFKGLYFESKPVSQGGSVVYLNLKEGKSRMILYYHNSLTDSLKYELVVNTNSSWVNLYKHEYEGSPIGSTINDSVYTHPAVYLHSMAGLRSHIKLELPEEILSQVKTGITVNKAELILPVANDPTVPAFARPASIRVFNRGENNKNVFLDDLALGEAYYGGTYESATSSYRFNIGRHIQNILHPDSLQRIPNNGLLIVITDERTSGNRLVLKNGNLPDGMKLVITYTPVH